MRYIVEASQVNNFKFCPYCGSKYISVYDGDYMGQTECLECENELEFTILEEMRGRYPESFEKCIRK